MLVILNIRYSLCQITIRADSGCVETVLDLAEKFFDNWNSIFTDHNTFHLNCFHLTIPFVISNISDCKSFNRISIEDFLNQLFRWL